MSNNETQIKHKFIAGGISGLTEVICTHPIDLIKTKLQEASQKNMIINDPKKFFIININYMDLGICIRDFSLE